MYDVEEEASPAWWPHLPHTDADGNRFCFIERPGSPLLDSEVLDAMLTEFEAALPFLPVPGQGEGEAQHAPYKPSPSDKRAKFPASS